MMQQFLFSSFHGSGGWRCSTHGKDEKRIGNFCRKALRKEQLGRPRHRWRTILILRTGYNGVDWPIIELKGVFL